MSGLLRVAAFEYRNSAFNRRFLFTLLGLPVLLVVYFIALFALVWYFYNPRPVGYVDRSGLSEAPFLVIEDPGSPKLAPFPSEEKAQAALRSRKIQAYLVIPPDYLQTRQARLVYLNQPPEVLFESQLDDLLRTRLLAGQPAAVTLRIVQGTYVIDRPLDEEADADPLNSAMEENAPLVIAFGFVMSLSLFSGYLAKAISDEKENRTIEVLAASISVEKLLAGKLLGIAGLYATLLAAWGAPLGVLVGVIAIRGGLAALQEAALNWNNVLAIIAIAIPACIVSAAWMLIAGAIFDSKEDGAAASMLVLGLAFLPLFFSNQFSQSSGEPWAVALSLAPVTALMAMSLRFAAGGVPGWQAALSIGLQMLYAVAAMWLTGRVVRWGMLLYGQGLTFKGLGRVLRSWRKKARGSA